MRILKPKQKSFQSTSYLKTLAEQAREQRAARVRKAA